MTWGCSLRNWSPDTTWMYRSRDCLRTSSLCGSSLLKVGRLGRVSMKGKFSTWQNKTTTFYTTNEIPASSEVLSFTAQHLMPVVPFTQSISTIGFSMCYTFLSLYSSTTSLHNRTTTSIKHLQPNRVCSLRSP